MKPEQKKIIKSKVKTTVDSITGEVIEIETINDFKVDREPDFVKLYLGDIGKLFNLPNTSLLMALLHQMNYDNEIVLNASIKRKICALIGDKMSLANLEKIISIYTKKEILIRKDRGLYMFNPYLFGRGSWKDINKIRLSISYSPEGKDINAIIESQPQH
jgi:hypothetical protein